MLISSLSSLNERNFSFIEVLQIVSSEPFASMGFHYEPMLNTRNLLKKDLKVLVTSYPISIVDLVSPSPQGS